MNAAKLLPPTTLLLLLSCAPQYESGKTACAATGQACPDGFVCVNIRCYKVGEAPGDASAGGSGGGGTGGATDARTTGTGGTGGAPDANRPPPDAAPASCTNNPMFPVACPMSEVPNICWSATTDCSSVKRCTVDRVYGCIAGFAVDCRYRANNCLPRAEVGGNRTCTENPMFPVVCPPLGDLGPLCVSSADFDCNARVVCGNEVAATICRKGDTIDCSKPRAERCIRPAGADGGTPLPDGGTTDAATDGRG